MWSRSLKLLFLSIAFCGSLNAEEVIIVGDSLTCGSFGQYLLENFSQKGDKVTLYCAVSSVPSNWLSGTNPKQWNPKKKEYITLPCKTMTSENSNLHLCYPNGKVPKFSDLLAKNKNARVVVALGTNSLMSSQANDSYRKMSVVAKSYGNSCDWISPPHIHPSQAKGFSKKRLKTEEDNVNSFFDSLSDQMSNRCNPIDSRDATAPGTEGYETTDGVHRTDLAGKYWADQIWPQISPSNRSVESAPGTVQ